ncbi:MAG: hypothetical protein EBQ89_00435 [Alphaproteobacteria bacterium]|nr:hypothetical protein [Alphaproteobacteria bacterium]NDG03328.1 hypothetical protein [Synechococcaceae bacterium WBB_34_004]
MTVNQFIRLAAELADKTADVRRTIEHMGAGNLAAAADTAGGRGSETWWAAEFFILRLSGHGATEAPRFKASEPKRKPQTAALFAD